MRELGWPGFGEAIEQEDSLGDGRSEEETGKGVLSHERLLYISPGSSGLVVASSVMPHDDNP
jgi:hypothetical protein